MSSVDRPVGQRGQNSPGVTLYRPIGQLSQVSPSETECFPGSQAVQEVWLTSPLNLPAWQFVQLMLGEVPSLDFAKVPAEQPLQPVTPVSSCVEWDGKR